MAENVRAYGMVNGKTVYSAEEFRYESRGFGEITSDEELIKFAEKVTWGWQSAGHKQSFANYYLSDYAMSEPFKSLTRKEFERLKVLQEEERAKLAEINKKYSWSNYEGRQMTETEVRLFLDKHVDLEVAQWGEDNFWANQAREYRDKTISKFKNGEVVKVDSEDYVASYGNGTGSYSRTLFSDGHIEDACFGYLD